MNFKTLINHSNWIQNKESWSIYSFKTWPGPAGRPDTRPIRDWNQAVLKKKQGKKKSGVIRLTRRPSWPGKTRLKTRLQPVDFFFTKTKSFWFFLIKKLTWATRWSGQNLKSGSWTRPATGLGLQTMSWRFKIFSRN
jgi:hypothetical protein